MSYIVPISILVSLIYFVLAQIMDQLVEEKKVFLITAILFFTMLMISI